MPTKTPILFIGHGSPMNALADNAFTQALSNLNNLCPNPKAILCISAHWMTEGTWVTHMEKPKTIHDFYGFPEELFAIQYPAPGSPKVAELICNTVPGTHLDDEMWGLDHGTWSVLRHIYPEANIPVLQLSLYISKPPEYHYKLGIELRKLREQGVLIIGSGNIVHNLRTIRWGENAQAYDWAIAFDQWSKECLQKRDFNSLVNNFNSTQDGKLSVPTPEHYYPLLYTLGACDETDKIRFEYEEIQNGSISMRTISFRAS